ncbi:MAG: hypothetical protein ACE5FZ_02840 [Nitrospiria bacterium]
MKRNVRDALRGMSNKNITSRYVVGKIKPYFLFDFSNDFIGHAQNTAWSVSISRPFFRQYRPLQIGFFHPERAVRPFIPGKNTGTHLEF